MLHYINLFCVLISFMVQFIHCTLHRDLNGLGFSIAGGQGSLPPPLDNEVSFADKYFKF